MDLGTFYREFQNPPQLSSLSIDIGAQSMAEDLVRKPPAPPHLVLWPPFLLPWPFPPQKPGDLSQLLPHARTSPLRPQGKRVRPSAVRPSPSCFFALLPAVIILNLCALISSFSLLAHPSGSHTLLLFAWCPLLSDATQPGFLSSSCHQLFSLPGRCQGYRAEAAEGPSGGVLALSSLIALFPCSARCPDTDSNDHISV